MVRVRVCEDPYECAHIWESAWPRQCFFDLWQVRNCFATSYKRRPYFLIAEKQKRIEGILALSWIEELHYFAHYPGETWKGKTWLEQNKIPASSPAVFAELISSVPDFTHLRFLTRDSLSREKTPFAVDEVGYLFYPGECGFSFQNYMQRFSGKSRKKLARELSVMEGQGVSYRHDHLDDIRYLYRMNLEAFGSASYFFEPSFLDSFEKLVVWLHQNNMLRVTTLLIGGTVAAVDIGAIWEKTYTVLAGATNPEFPGVAKMINFHHLEWSCGKRMEVVDFLCGDFGWKQRFHLTARPLFELLIQPEKAICPHEAPMSVKFSEQYIK